MLKEKYTLKNFLSFIIILAVIVLFAVVMIAERGEESAAENENIVAYFGQTEVMLEVADTPDARGQGLSGREALADGAGMLFVFDESDQHGIWMKDMNFSLDVLWLDEDFRTIYIVEGMTPESFPTVYRSSKPARYVVELPAGFVSAHGIHIHDQMTPSRALE